MKKRYQVRKEIGDRYKALFSHPSVGSLVEITTNGRILILEGPHKGGTFSNDGWTLDDENDYEYLGNFRKDTSLTNLYSILCS